MFGLDANIVKELTSIFANHKKVDKVILYGSRAKGTFRSGSDVDLTLVGKDVNLKTVYAISDEIEELFLPYRFDISVFEYLDNPDLVEHIRRVGKVFYQRKGLST